MSHQKAARWRVLAAALSAFAAGILVTWVIGKTSGRAVAMESSVTADFASRTSSRHGEPRLMVNGVVLTDAMIGTYAEQTVRRQRLDTDDDRQLAARELTKIALFAERARRIGLDVEPAVRARLENARLKVLAAAYSDRVSRQADISERRLRKAYRDQMESLWPRQYKLAFLVFRRRAAARRAAERLKGGESFDSLPAASGGKKARPAGVPPGWVGLYELPGPLRESIRPLGPGDHTPDPIKYRKSWLIVRALRVHKPQRPGFGEVRDQLKRFLRKREVQKVGEKLMRNASIKRLGRGQGLGDGQRW
jgi:hypothetical protein